MVLRWSGRPGASKHGEDRASRSVRDFLVQPLARMPADPLPGGRSDMPLIQGPDFGASERLVVSPGVEDRGIFQMPCGQSGHPLRPFIGPAMRIGSRPTHTVLAGTGHYATLV